MRIYLASRYSRHLEMQEVAKLLQEDGHQITSRWIYGNHQIPEEVQGLEREQEAVKFAQEDTHDVRRADAIVMFAESTLRSPTRGGRHVEFGIALERGLELYVVGGKQAERENIFYWLPEVQYVDSLEELRDLLKGL